MTWLFEIKWAWRFTVLCSNISNTVRRLDSKFVWNSSDAIGTSVQLHAAAMPRGMMKLEKWNYTGKKERNGSWICTKRIETRARQRDTGEKLLSPAQASELFNLINESADINPFQEPYDRIETFFLHKGAYSICQFPATGPRRISFPPFSE